MKRAFDIVFSSVVLIFFLPLFALVTLLIKRDSTGPVFFRQVRVGRHGKEFRVLKFRTMIVNDGSSGVFTTPTDDPRITPLGYRLRKYNIDELPQFINVLRGEMSVVGPRPEIPLYAGKFSAEERREILSLRPGITDLSTLWIGDKGALVTGASDPEKVYVEVIRPEKIRLQREYVRKRSMWLDIKIIYLTFHRHMAAKAVFCILRKVFRASKGGSLARPAGD